MVDNVNAKQIAFIAIRGLGLTLKIKSTIKISR
jgi:hypothetical protein